MSQTQVSIRTIHAASAAVGWAGQRTLTIDRPVDAGGTGIGYTGGELLLLAVGACYTNDIFREAKKMGIDVRSVSVDVQADWNGDPVRAQNLTYSTRVEADAPEEAIRELVEHTDKVAEIHNSLRRGTEVSLTAIQAVPASP